MVLLDTYIVTELTSLDESDSECLASQEKVQQAVASTTKRHRQSLAIAAETLSVAGAKK